MNGNPTERSEPFSTVHELVGEHGIDQVLDALAGLAPLMSKDEANYLDRHRKQFARLHLELEQLPERMTDFRDVIETGSDDPTGLN
jgi:hypothetical protein